MNFLQSNFGLSGSVFLVTGGARGIGFEAARAAGMAGAKIAINDQNTDATESAAEKLRAEGLDAFAAPFSVTNADAVRNGVKRVLDHYGRIDTLFSNAGIQNRKPFTEYSSAEWQAIQDTHVTGAFNVCQAVLPSMVAREAGQLILMSSVTAFGSRGTVSAYATAKGALATLTKALAIEYGPKGIRCNALAPGFVATTFTEAMQGNEAFERYIQTEVPLQRWGRPEDISSVVVFLASPASRFITGHVLAVDGGLLATL